MTAAKEAGHEPLGCRRPKPALRTAPQADSELKGWYLDNLFGYLWRRQEWEIYAATLVRQVLRCSARVVDRYRRRDRDVVARETLVPDEVGQLIARTVH